MPPQETVLTFEAARATVEKHAATIPPPAKETHPLETTQSRILAEPITADRNIPPFPRTMRDGYALRSADLPDFPTKLKVLGEIKAGADPTKFRLQPGEAVSIMTGAPAPTGADAVVMVEHTTADGDTVEINRAINPGENIVPTGAEARQGDTLLTPGTRIDERVIAVAASAGKIHLQVYTRPQVAILSTGDELVSLDQTPGPFQIRNSNSHSLAAQVRHAGGDPIILPIAPDEKTQLRKLIENGLTADLLLLSGGVSVGRYDFVEQVLEDLNAEFFFTGARIQPGKPVVFGRAGTRAAKTYFFGLPGNPVSTMVTFKLFARPILEALAGATPRPIRFLHARLKTPITRKPGLTRFLPATLTGQLENTEVELTPWQGSGDLASTARTHCYAVIGPDREHYPAGEWIPLLLQ